MINSLFIATVFLEPPEAVPVREEGSLQWAPGSHEEMGHGIYHAGPTGGIHV
jgi:hypothetical protein